PLYVVTLVARPPPRSTLLPYPPLFRSRPGRSPSGSPTSDLTPARTARPSIPTIGGRAAVPSPVRDPAGPGRRRIASGCGRMAAARRLGEWTTSPPRIGRPPPAARLTPVPWNTRRCSARGWSRDQKRPTPCGGVGHRNSGDEIAPGVRPEETRVGSKPDNRRSQRASREDASPRRGQGGRDDEQGVPRRDGGDRRGDQERAVRRDARRPADVVQRSLGGRPGRAGARPAGRERDRRDRDRRGNEAGRHGTGEEGTGEEVVGQEDGHQEDPGEEGRVGEAAGDGRA